MKTIRNLLALALVVAAGGWAYHTNVASAPPAMDMSARVTGSASPFPVALAPVERGRIQGSVVYTGSVAPYNEEDIYPRVTGQILEMPVYPGDLVRAGQVLARLDDTELDSRLREAQATVITTRAGRAQMEADLAVARHGVAQVERELVVVEAEAGYQATVAARDERLVARGAVSQQEAEGSRTAAAAAQARVLAAQARVEQARALEASARRRLEAAEAAVAQVEAQARTVQVVRDYVNIRATAPGYVVKRLVAPGVLVQPGTPLLKIAQIDRVRLQANVGERDLPQLRVGSSVQVAVAGNGGALFTSRVSSVFPFVDPGARTAVVEAVMENAGRRLLPGQYVTMRFVVGERNGVLTVPGEAVIRMGGRASVWVARENRAERREVTTGLEAAERVEILSGLAEGEQVVRQGHGGLYAGAQIAAAAAPGGFAPPAPAAPAAGMDGHGQAGPSGMPVGGAQSAPAKRKEGGHAGH